MIDKSGLRGFILVSLSFSHYKGGHYSFICSMLFKNEFLIVKNVLYEKRRKVNALCVFILFYKLTLIKMQVQFNEQSDPPADRCQCNGSSI